MEDKGYFSKVYLQDSSCLQLMMSHCPLFVKVERDTSTKRSLYPMFRQKRGQRTLPASVDSPLLSAPKSPDAKVF